MAADLEEEFSQAEQHAHYIQTLKEQFLTEIADLDYYLNQDQGALPHILNMGFPGHLNEQILMRLDLAGIAISSGSACTAGVVQKSHVLEALYGKDSTRLSEAIRISFSELNTPEEITKLSQTIKEIIGGAPTWHSNHQ